MIVKKEFEVLFETHYTGLFAYAYRYLQSRDAAEDIVQEAFCSLWLTKNNLESINSAKSYLYSSIKNKCLNIIKHNNVHLKYETVIKNNGEPAEYFSGDEFEQGNIMDYFNCQMEKLPSDLKEIFLMNKIDKLTAKEISVIKDISVRTIEGQIARAIKILKENMGAPNYWLLAFLFFK